MDKELIDVYLYATYRERSRVTETIKDKIIECRKSKNKEAVKALEEILKEV